MKNMVSRARISFLVMGFASMMFSPTASAESSSERFFEPFDQFTEPAATRAPASYRPVPRKPEAKPTTAPEAESKPVEAPPAEPSSAASTVNANDSTPSQGDKDFGLTGDWGGARARLDAKGVNLAVVYKGESSRVMSGGLARDASDLQNLDLRLAVDMEKAAGWKGFSFFLYGLGNWGGSSERTPSRAVGDIQSTSNLETLTDTFKLYEAWAQQQFADGKASLLLGIHDLNSEFYVTDTSGLFFNASFGVGKELSQSGVMGPSIFAYPTTALRLRASPTERFYLQAGVFNAKAGDPDDPKTVNYEIHSNDGFLLITEAAFVGTEESPSKYAVGYWTYTRTFDPTDEAAAAGAANPVANSGAYLLLDQSFGKSLSAFLRFGAAASAPNTVKSNLSSGLVFKGPLPFRGDDKLGLAFTQASPTSSAESIKPEVTYELSYRIECGHGIALQPDLQFVQNPSFSTTVDNAFVGAVRLEVGL